MPQTLLCYVTCFPLISISFRHLDIIPFLLLSLSSWGPADRPQPWKGSSSLPVFAHLAIASPHDVPAAVAVVEAIKKKRGGGYCKKSIVLNSILYILYSRCQARLLVLARWSKYPMERIEAADLSECLCHPTDLNSHTSSITLAYSVMKCKQISPATQFLAKRLSLPTSAQTLDQTGESFLYSFQRRLFIRLMGGGPQQCKRHLGCSLSFLLLRLENIYKIIQRRWQRDSPSSRCCVSSCLVVYIIAGKRRAWNSEAAPASSLAAVDKKGAKAVGREEGLWRRQRYYIYIYILKTQSIRERKKEKRRLPLSCSSLYFPGAAASAGTIY